MLFLGHNLVEIFSHHCSRIALEHSRRELPKLGGPYLETFQARIPRHRLVRRASSSTSHRTGQLSFTICCCFFFSHFHRKRESQLSIAIKRDCKIFISRSDLTILKIKDGVDDDVTSLSIPGGRIRRSCKIP